MSWTGTHAYHHECHDEDAFALVQLGPTRTRPVWGGLEGRAEVFQRRGESRGMGRNRSESDQIGVNRSKKTIADEGLPPKGLTGSIAKLAGESLLAGRRRGAIQ